MPELENDAVEDFYLLKVDALRRLADMLGMFPRTADQAAENRAKIGDEILWGALHVLSTEGQSASIYEACASLIDMISLDWRVKYPGKIGGLIRDRGDRLVQKWRVAVLERDGHACQRCGDTRNLHAHHIIRWKDNSALRTVVSNGITLCEQCHKDEHARG